MDQVDDGFNLFTLAISASLNEPNGTTLRVTVLDKELRENSFHLATVTPSLRMAVKIEKAESLVKSAIADPSTFLSDRKFRY